MVGKRVHLEQVAPARLVDVREGRSALERERLADGIMGCGVQLRRRLAERLARGLRHARYATLAVKLHDLGRDQLVGHAHVVLLALHEPAAVARAAATSARRGGVRGRVSARGCGVGRCSFLVKRRIVRGRSVDLLLGRGEHVAQNRVVLAERVDERVGLLDGARGVVRPLRHVGLARRLVLLQVAEALALPPQAGRRRRVVRDAHGRRWRVGKGDVGETSARAALLVCQGCWGGIGVAIFGV
jgi:hypothetical protein